MGSNIQLSSHGRGSRRRSWRRNPEINVTPLVDVMLVLLIVFMVTAPLLTVSVPVDLPKTQGKSVAQDKEPLIITIDTKGNIYLQETPVELETLVMRLRGVSGVNPDARIFVRGDKNLSYGRIMEVMGTVTSAGYSKVALVADLPRARPAGVSKAGRTPLNKAK
ncbi:MAG: protein TolR [Alphaproteobacteria bacterium]|nr:protein TolR [Alphaproteobacteria bacterium]